MSGGMAFRKDCEECGRSFLTPDKTTRICQRCAGKGQPKPQSETVTRKGTSPKAAGNTKKPIENSPTCGPAHVPTSLVLEEKETKENEHELTEPEPQQAPQKKEKAGPKEAPPTPVRKREETPLTPAQIQEIADRYRKFVESLERPSIGRRKTIAADIGLPYQIVIRALRQWNQQQAQVENLVREQRYAIEKIYFSHLEEEISFPEVKVRIVQATGLNPWAVSRYLDLIHNGGRNLRNVPPVSSEQETSILGEYQQYLSASGHPEPPLHTLIAERTGVTAKQVHKVLLTYRLSRFREKWGRWASGHGHSRPESALSPAG